MKPKLVIASGNPHKRDELSRLLPGIDLILLPADIALPAETAITFEGNALLKAVHVARALSAWVLADDSGLQVDALNGEPGVYSARYAEEGTDQANRDKVLAHLQGQPSDATMVSVVAVVDPLGHHVTVRGEVHGSIVPQRGTQGFGYDPIFYVPALGQTFGEVTPEEKMTLSHRAKAIEQLQQTLLWRAFIDGPHQSTD
jgi:XTP/dITP diphosphohydrolase